MSRRQAIREAAAQIPSIGELDRVLSGIGVVPNYGDVARAISLLVREALVLLAENEDLRSELVETQQALARLIVKMGKGE